MRKAIPVIVFGIAQVIAHLAWAQDAGTRPQADAAAASVREQNAILEKRLKLLEQRAAETQDSSSDLVTKQTEMFEQRRHLIAQQENLNLAKRPTANNTIDWSEGPHQHRDDILIENSNKAYKELAPIAVAVAKELECGGKNVVLYGAGQGDALLSVRAFNDQLAVLRARLQSVLEVQAPTAPDRAAQAAGAGVYSVAALAGPVQQSVLDLIAFLPSAGLHTYDVPLDDKGVIAAVASAATAEGCLVYWPDQYVTNPFGPASQIATALSALADLNDNGGVAAKQAGLQQRIRLLRVELKRSELMSETLRQKIEREDVRLDEATKRVEFLRTRIDWISDHIKDERNATIQAKLNSTFDKSWADLESAVRKQLTLRPPQTIEQQNAAGEMLKNLDLLKTRTDWLAQYVKDEKDLILQDRVKHELAAVWDQLGTAVKDLEAATLSVPRTQEPDTKEKQRWDRYSSELKELIATSVAASEAYTTFRGALLDGAGGSSPLSRMLRAEALRDLTFDDKFQERDGATVVQLRVQQLAGTYITDKDREDFSGGVVLSFVQYEPNGRVKRSGVRSGYSPFNSKIQTAP